MRWAFQGRRGGLWLLLKWLGVGHLVNIWVPQPFGFWSPPVAEDGRLSRLRFRRLGAASGSGPVTVSQVNQPDVRFMLFPGFAAPHAVVVDQYTILTSFCWSHGYC